MTPAIAAKKRKRGVNLARLNHILIPQRSDQRDKLRRSTAGWLLAPVWWLGNALTREGRALVGISVMVGVAGLDVGNSQVYLLWAALSGLLAGSLLARPLYSMRAAKLRVVAPKRAIAHAPVVFDIEVESPRPVRAVRFETPFLPWDGRWLGRPAGIATVDAGAIGRSSVAARFVERGEHHLDPFAARAMVPFGLAVGAGVTSGTCRFLVLPRPAHVGPIELTAGGGGERRRVASHVLGPTGDLAGVRPYRPGDPIRHLHARTWARAGTPHVREHVRERNERSGLVFAVDQTSHERVAEAAISLAAGVAASLAHGTGGLGLVALGADVGLAPSGAAPRVVVDETMDRLAVHRVVAKLAVDAATTAIVSALADVSSVVLIAADRDDAPGELTPEAAALAEALRQASVAVRVLLVVDEDVVPETGRDLVRVGRPAIEGEIEIRI